MKFDGRTLLRLFLWSKKRILMVLIESNAITNLICQTNNFMSNSQTVLFIPCMQKTTKLGLDFDLILILVTLRMIVIQTTTNGITFYVMLTQVCIMIMAVRLI